MHEKEAPYITVIGGGTGSSTLLDELKHHTPNLAAVVNMSDDGGSSGRLRKKYGVMPPGDVRQCLTALSDSEPTKHLFKIRFDEGEFAGDAFGNILLAHLELKSDFSTAVKRASELLAITGQVIPVTLDNHDLVMQDGDEIIHGEYAIANRPIEDPTPRLWLEPAVKLSKDAEAAIYQADQIVIAPGNTFGSILPSLLVDGMQQTLTDAPGQKVVVSNLMTNPGQTDSWHVLDYVELYESYTGRMDTVLYNNQLLSPGLQAGCGDSQQQVGFDQNRFGQRPDIEAIGDAFVNSTLYEQDPNDKAVQRTALRHDASKISQHLIGLATQGRLS